MRSLAWHAQTEKKRQGACEELALFSLASGAMAQLSLLSEQHIGPEAVLRVYETSGVEEEDADLLELRARCRRKEPRTFLCYGRLCTQPRRQLVFGKPYRFSGQTFQPEISDSALVARCREQVHALEGTRHELICVVNLYEHGEHYIAHHRDDEEAVCAGAPIYTFVFGPATRPFQVKGPDKTLHNVDLHHGHVGVMVGRLFQSTCTHSVPRRARVKDWRLSVTLRRASS